MNPFDALDVEAELAWRDARIAQLANALATLIKEVGDNTERLLKGYTRDARIQ